MCRLALALLACSGCNSLLGLDNPVRATVHDGATVDDAALGGMLDGPLDGPPDTLVAPAGFVRRIDIVDAMVTGGPHVDFPLLVSGSTTWLRDAANGGDVARGDGFDIYFSDDQAGTTRLAHEVESYTPATGTLVAWVKVPSLVASKVLYNHYGNAAITTSQQDVAGVWTASYQQVLHLTGTTADATGKTASITSSNVTTSAAGKIGGTYTFNGADSEINTGSVSAVDNVFTGGGSIEAWIRPSGFGEISLGRILEKGSANGWAWYVDNVNRPGAVTFLHGAEGVDGLWVSPSNSIALNSWHHVTVVYDKGAATNDPVMFIDGALVTPTRLTNLQGNLRTDAAASITVGNSAAGDRAYAGAIDEVRLSSVSRSSGWFRTQHRNQSAPSTFYAISNPL
jgi:hypothetical protein